MQMHNVHFVNFEINAEIKKKTGKIIGKDFFTSGYCYYFDKVLQSDWQLRVPL